MAAPLSYQNWANWAFANHQITNVSADIWVCQHVGKHCYLKSSLNLVDQMLVRQLNPVQRKHCTLMVVTNLAYPEWISVLCNVGILKTAVCYSEHRVHDSGFRGSKISKDACSKPTVLKNNTCVLFAWYDRKIFVSFKPTAVCKTLGMNNYSFDNITFLAFIMDATNKKQFTLLSTFSSGQYVLSHKYQRMFFRSHYTQQLVKTEKAVGYFLCTTASFKQLPLLNHSFYCKNGRLISMLYICDRENDCEDSIISDEHNCTCDLALFQKKISGECLAYMKADTGVTIHKSTHYTCVDNSTIDALFINDLVVDCEAGEDEHHLYSLLLDDMHLSCLNADQIPCRDGHSKCFNFSEVCLFKLNSVNHMVPCRTGEHLEECKQFECNLNFKCPYFYCVLYSGLCDGKWDCPNGEDEGHQCGNNRTCPNMFKCKYSSSCIHIRNVCDGIVDCNLKDDEMLCDIKDVCPLFCVCFLYGLKCIGGMFSPDSIRGTPYISYHMMFAKITNASFLFESPNAEFIVLNFNQLQHVCYLPVSMSVLKVFDVANNIVENIELRCFSHLDGLLEVNLSRNQIGTLAPKSFVSLLKLAGIDFSDNFLSHLPPSTFINISSLKLLVLSRNPLNSIWIDMLLGLEVSELVSDDYRLCCIVPPSTKCPTAPAWYTSCSNMLPHLQMRVSLIVVSFLIVFPNVVCLAGNLCHIHISKKGWTSYITVCFINFSDSLCGVYLGLIWGADLYYGKKFIMNDQGWKSGCVCLLAFFFCLSFNLMISCFLFELTLARLMIIVNPFKSRFRSHSFVFKVMFKSFITLISVSAILTVQVGRKGPLPSNLCSPYIDPTDSVIEIEIHTWILTSIQSSILTFLVGADTKILRVLTDFTEQKKILPKRRTNTAVLVQLITVTVSNMLCWLSCGIIYLSSMLLDYYSIDLVIWATIAIMPVNSCANPLIFLLNFRRKKAGSK